MARADTWMPIYWGDYAKDTGHLGAAHHGAYLMLIKHYWTQGAPLPADDAQLWRIACADSLAHWRKIKAVVLAFFEERDGRLYHKRVEEEMAKAEENADRRVGSAKRAAEARWEQERARGNAPRNPRRTAPRIPDAVPGECAPPSPSPSPSPIHDEEPGGESLSDEPVDPSGEPARQSSLPPFLRRQPDRTAALIRPDFQPESETRDAVLTARPDLTAADIDRRHGEFLTWCAEKAITSHNFDATWYGFMVKTHAQSARNGRHQPAGEEDPVTAGIRESLARRHVLAGG